MPPPYSPWALGRRGPRAAVSAPRPPGSLRPNAAARSAPEPLALFTLPRPRRRLSLVSLQHGQLRLSCLALWARFESLRGRWVSQIAPATLPADGSFLQPDANNARDRNAAASGAEVALEKPASANSGSGPAILAAAVPPAERRLSQRGALRQLLEADVQRLPDWNVATFGGEVALEEPASASPDSTARVTKLPNGLRVATENTPGHFAALGIYLDAGSRYETGGTRGCSHLVGRLAFKVRLNLRMFIHQSFSFTADFGCSPCRAWGERSNGAFAQGTARRTEKDIQDEVQLLGGSIVCSFSRESIMYQAAVIKDDVPRAFNLLADVMRRLEVSERDLHEQRQTEVNDIEDIRKKAELFIPEEVHMTAFSGSTLGLPLLCDKARLASVQLCDIQSYLRTFYRPSRVVVAACGVDHEMLLELAKLEFGDWRDPPDGPAPEPATARTAAALTALTPDRLHPGGDAEAVFAQ
ncbi:MAG: Metalloenzyme, LuxS/M16 peptidase-like protein, partial [Olpidium bornovanus]